MKMLRLQCKSHSVLLLLLLLTIRGALSVPALDATPPAATPNTIDESDKLLEGSGEIAPTNNSSETSPQVAESSEVSSAPDNEASASSMDPTTIYAGGLITPEAFQQYLSQYGAAAYAPFGGGYPAPISAGAPGLYPYPGPIVVQTGYEGFLVPANAAGQADTTAVVAPVPAPASSNNPLLAFASKLLPTILMSTLFRIAAVVLSAVGVILFGSAITSALCRMTPICDIPAKAADILRSGGAQDVGRMLADEMTPERVRRATEFVRNAIRKYRQLQKLVEPQLEAESS
ncbi:uncharacterized protein LOC111082653 [Drosophila obscura]|uniref:uncharacterized protein LOC111082653 n=1 Tax=Drosophila obscura TaxID=7282 RepID=UPI001BB239F9|nr:uncharacterized protein LOC111082653 [Drosophila obscura]